jgi:glycosyltransferase involved in cell wall biosynthesis
MKISVITPTIFRSSLKYCVEEVDKLLREGDEHIVVFDTNREPQDKELYKSAPFGTASFYETGLPNHNFGNLQRDAGIEVATGEALVFLDDDDIPFKAAYDVLHNLEYDRDTVHMFKMYHTPMGKMLTPNKQQYGCIGTPMWVVPKRDDLPKWADNNGYDSDFLFFTNLKKMSDIKIVCHEEVICIVPKQNFGQ